MTDKGSYPSTYTLSSGEAAKAELRELREVAEEMAGALRYARRSVSGSQIAEKREVALARYEALRDG